jgi:hypothetical protein
VIKTIENIRFSLLFKLFKLFKFFNVFKVFKIFKVFKVFKFWPRRVGGPGGPGPCPGPAGLAGRFLVALVLSLGGVWTAIVRSRHSASALLVLLVRSSRSVAVPS